jgi:GxxExxY protein
MRKLNEITHEIIGAGIEVHRRLGPGLLESAYEACMEYELKKRGLTVERQKPVPVIYDEVKLDIGYRIDLFVEGCVVVELKAQPDLPPIIDAQVLTYLRLLQAQVGLIINFHALKLVEGVKRLVNDYRPEPELQGGIS